MKTTRARRDRRSCSGGFPTCESTSRAPSAGSRRLCGESTFPRAPFSALRPTSHSAFCNLHSQNPYCTALFCAVPRNRIFSFFYFSRSFSFVAFVCFVVPSSRPTTSSYPNKLPFPPQLLAITLCNPFQPRTAERTPPLCRRPIPPHFTEKSP